MCFKRIKNFIYMDNTLPWVTYNNLRANKTSWGIFIIEVIDHKNTIAILHALVKILGDFLRIRRITLHVHRYSLCVCNLKLSDTGLQSIFVVYTLLI